MGKLKAKFFHGMRSIGISVLIFPLHKRSTARQVALDIFTDVFHRGGVVVEGTSKARGS